MLNNARQYQAMLGNVGQCRAMLGNVGQCRAMQGNAGQCWTIPGDAKQCWAMSGNIRQCWVRPGQVRQYWVILGNVGQRLGRIMVPSKGKCLWDQSPRQRCYKISGGSTEGQRGGGGGVNIATISTPLGRGEKFYADLVSFTYHCL